MKGKIHFIGLDAPKDVMEFEVPSPERPKPPPGYRFTPIHGSDELLRRQMNGGSLIVRWAWDPKPKDVRVSGGLACRLCGKQVSTQRGLSVHFGLRHPGETP